VVPSILARATASRTGVSKVLMSLRPLHPFGPAGPLIAAPLLLGFLFLGSCSSGGGQSSSLRLSFDTTTPAAGGDVIYLRLRDASGNLAVLDVVGRNLAAPVDGIHLVLSFDPAVVEAFGALGDTALGTCGRTRPDNSILVCADDIGNGQAASTGVLLFSAVPQGSPGSPQPVTIAGDVVLATLSFRASAAGTSSIDFYVAARPAPGSGSFSQVTSASDPAGASAVTFHPDAPGVASLRVTRR